MAAGVSSVSDDVDPRFEALLAQIQRLAGGELSARGEVEGEDVFGAIMAGLNMLGEELEHAMASQRTMSSLVDASSDCIAVLERSGELAFLNQAGRKMAGDTCLAPGAAIQDCFDARGNRVLTDVALPTVQQTGGWKGQLKMRTGTHSEVDVSLFSLNTDDGPRVAAIARDVSDAVRTHHDLRQLATAVEHSEAPIFVTSTNGAIQYINPAFERVTGYSRDEVVGKNARILQSGHHGSEFYREFWARITAGEIWTGRFVNRKKSGELYEEHTTVLPILDGRGRLANFVAVRRDISREVELEAKLRQAQKMEAIGRLAGGIAHEFNNLLAVIQSSADFLVTDDASAEVRTDAEIILKATRRAAQLTRQLVTFSRRDVVRPTSVDLNEQVRQMGQMLQRLIRADIELNLKLTSEPAIIRIGTGHLEQVLVNMTLNARDAMPNGGTITIAVEHLEPDEIPTSLHWRPGQRAVRLSVADTGEGMTRDMLNHAFEPFFTTKEHGRGTGLGLAVCYGIVRQNDGQITAESTPDVGTTFATYFPLRSEPTDEDVLAVASKLPRGEEIILLVEDDAEVRAAASRVLKRTGYQVLTANNGVEALELIGRTEHSIDLMLTDIIMPVMGGRELADEVQRQFPTIKVLFMSGYSAQTPSEPLVRKPFTADELTKMVRATLKRD